MRYSEHARRRQAMDASAASGVIWEMEGQVMDLTHCLYEVREAIASEIPGHAATKCREVRDRITQLLKDCDTLDDRIKLDQLLSKCPE